MQRKVWYAIIDAGLSPSVTQTWRFVSRELRCNSCITGGVCCFTKEVFQMNESSIAIITARGGSKRIPHKNIKDFCGKPIITYSIEAALHSEWAVRRQ